MKKSIGQSIREAREAKFKDLKYTGPMRKALAKKLEITPAYLGHIENDSHVRVSERIVEALKKVLGLKLSPKSVEAHNKRASAWYKAYHAERAK